LKRPIDGQEAPRQGAVDRARSLRIDIEKLDRLLNVTGEISIARGRFRQLAEAMLGGAAGPLIELHREADRLHLELQDLVMKIRMVPIGPMFRQYVRTVRDIAA